MPELNRPRPQPAKPQQYPGFEVVEDEPAPPPARTAQPRPKSLPPLPGERPPAAAKPATPVAKPTPAPRPAPPTKAAPPAKPAFEVVDDDDTQTAPAAKAKTVEVRKQPARAERDEDDRPRKGRAARDDEDDRPRKKSGKKSTGKAKTADEHAEELRERRLREFEIIWPTVLLVLGAVMAFAGALGASGLNGFLTIGVLVVGLLISIPVTIVTLMVVGMVAGINYGRFGPAVLKIAAITFVVNGVYFVGEWFKVPLFIIGPIGCAVAFGLFKTQFDLDNGETNTSMGALNVVTFAGKVLIMIFLVAAEAKLDRNSGPDLDDDDNPFPTETETRRDRGKWKGKNQPTPAPVVDPDDDPDPDDDN